VSARSVGVSPADTTYLLISIEYMISGVRKVSFEELKREVILGVISLHGPSWTCHMINACVIRSLSPSEETDISDTIACMVLM
jgi:hypothetical protein